MQGAGESRTQNLGQGPHCVWGPRPNQPPGPQKHPGQTRSPWGRPWASGHWLVGGCAFGPGPPSPRPVLCPHPTPTTASGLRAGHRPSSDRNCPLPPPVPLTPPQTPPRATPRGETRSASHPGPHGPAWLHDDHAPRTGAEPHYPGGLWTSLSGSVPLINADRGPLPASWTAASRPAGMHLWAIEARRGETAAPRYADGGPAPGAPSSWRDPGARQGSAPTVGNADLTRKEQRP